MDPQACIDRIVKAHDEGDSKERDEAIEDLREWLASGGFGVPMHPRMRFPAPPVCTAYWNDRSWLLHWIYSGAAIEKAGPRYDKVFQEGTARLDAILNGEIDDE